LGGKAALRDESRIGKTGNLSSSGAFELRALRVLEEDTRAGTYRIRDCRDRTGAEFYVVRDATTRKCTVVDTKPTSTTTTIVDNGTFKTKTEAETSMKTMKVCTN
jgi:hypothetical protein